MAIDGRQSHSSGALDYETGAWMLLVGAHDAINLDGGGSATMSMLTSTGQPLRLNYSSAVADSGKERTVGSHFGVYAKPLVTFVSNLTVSPEDEAATITWNTAAPANSFVEFGLTDTLGQISALNSAAATGHSVRLTGLTPGTGYYFRAVSETNGQRNESALQFFTTTRTITATEVIPLNGQWRHTSADVSGSNWTAPGFNDSGWDGPAAGVLWAYTRAGDPPLDLGLLGGRLDGNPGTGFPYVTYYFRTHFTASTAGVGTSLAFNGYLDDGAVFYLNGHEILRLRRSPIQRSPTAFPAAATRTARIPSP
jgi:Phosphodiester glycosidase